MLKTNVIVQIEFFDFCIFLKTCSFENSSDFSVFLYLIYSLNSDLFLNNTSFSNLSVTFSSLIIFDGIGENHTLNVNNCFFSNIYQQNLNLQIPMIKISNSSNFIVFSSCVFNNMTTSNN